MEIENQITPIQACDHGAQDAVIFQEGKPLVFKGAFVGGKLDPEVEKQIKNQFGDVSIIKGAYTNDTLTLGD